MAQPDKQILIAGAGIAGLSSALAFADRGYRVSVFERAERLEEFGAGLQVSPNAARILKRLGVLDRLMPAACQPKSICLIDAQSGRELTRVPLGDDAEARWGAPYLVAHRADLQKALVASASGHDEIEIVTGATVRDAHGQDKSITIDKGGSAFRRSGELLIAADGVWSALRAKVQRDPQSRFTGYIAWRALVEPRQAEAIAGGTAADQVTAFLAPEFHLVAYPVMGGKMVNLIAVTPGTGLAERWIIDADASRLRAALDQSCAAELAKREIEWTAWPLHEVDPTGQWSDGEFIVLVGDAAHAMTPFGAQGAAMAIEDAFVLAGCVAMSPDMGSALRTYEAARRPRIQRVVRRGAFNRFTWHASGPVALVRNLVLRARPKAGLMRDFDWLYGYDATRSGPDFADR